MIYRVKVVVETVVQAKSPEEARQQALWVSRYEDEQHHVEDCDEVTSLDKLPYGWNGRCIPWGSKNEKMLGELLDD